MRSGKKLTCLVRENGFSDIVDRGEIVMLFLSAKGSYICDFERLALAFCRPNIFSRLVHVAFLRFDSVRVISGYVLLCEKRPADKVAGPYRFEPSRFYRITAYRMHPTNTLFNGWEVIDVVGFT